MGYIKFMGAILLTSLFAIAITSYAIGFGNDNDTTIKLGDDSEVTTMKSRIESDVVTFKTQTNDTSGVFYDTLLESGDQSTSTGGQFKGGVSGAFSSLKSSLSLAYTKIFGDEQGSNGFGIILTALVSFFTFLLVLYMYKAWVGKNPD